jgi:hypothetical protein
MNSSRRVAVIPGNARNAGSVRIAREYMDFSPEVLDNKKSLKNA